ncbi:MAG: response regulator [Flavobacteriales bacterium]|jgi:DNA-binding response OmpR family regulator
MQKNVVIIVDDDLTILELLRYQITDAIGEVCDVELATSGSEVEELLATLKSQNRIVKVLVTDYFLDDTTGSEIISRVKEIYPNCSTVLLTGQHQRDIERVADSPISPDRYFSKPWNSFELKSHLNNLLDLK